MWRISANGSPGLDDKLPTLEINSKRRAMVEFLHPASELSLAALSCSHELLVLE